MAAWTSDELDKIGQSDELELSSQRADGSLRAPVTMWVVRLGEDVYVRAVRGRDGWYQGTRSRHAGHIECGGVNKDVAFVDADSDQSLNDAIDSAYRTKYSRYADSIVSQVLNEQARSATLKLAPR